MQTHETRPIVGLITQTLKPIPGQVPLAWVIGQQYVRSLTEAGALPWIVPLFPDDPHTMRELFNQLDGLFLAGGLDIEPTQYGEAVSSHCGLTDADRDTVESQFIRWAKQVKMPTLGVCRGVQMINVALGGSLFQDLATDCPEAAKHDYFPQQGYTDRSMMAHPVHVTPRTRLHELVGHEISVNSMHHQGIKKLGKDLVVSARAPDGVIEGIEGTNGHFLMGVQWHPEELTNSEPVMRRVFEAFVSAARDFRTATRTKSHQGAHS